MAHDCNDVKKGLGHRCLDWIDAHPRTGWYIVIIATLNFLLNLADAIDLV
jgi:hypothetical protein